MKRIGAAVAGGVLLVVCGGGEDQGPLALVEAARGGDSALLAGRLVVDGECLYVEGSDGERTLPILPEGTTWDDETGTLALRGLKFRDGGAIVMGGGEGSSDGDAWLDDVDWVERPDDSCDLDQTWWSDDGSDQAAGMASASFPQYATAEPLELSGTITGEWRLEDGCRYLVEPDGTRWQPVFLYPTTLQTPAHSVGGFLLGRAAELAGAEVHIADQRIEELPGAWASPLNAGCDTSRLWLVAGGHSLDGR